MTPTHAYERRGGVHRYYVSSSVNRGTATRRAYWMYRLPALPVERWAIETLHCLVPDHEPLGVLARIEVHDQAVQIALRSSALAPEERSLPLVLDRLERHPDTGERLHRTEDRIWIHIPRRLQFRGGRAWLSGELPKRGRLSQALIKGLKRGHELVAAGVDPDGVLQQAPSTAHERTLIQLAWLAPDVQTAILDGRQKPGLCLDDLRAMTIPLCWDDQRALL